MPEISETPGQPVVPAPSLSIGIIKAISLTAIYILVNIAFSFLLSRLTEGGMHSYEKLLISIGMLAGIIVVMKAARITKAQFISFLKPSGLNFSALLLLVSVPVFLQILGSELLVWSREIFPWDDMYNKLMETFGPDGSRADLIGAFITMAVAGPLCEELLFRGVIQTDLEARFSCRLAAPNFIQAFLFALSHLNPWQTFYAFPVGLILAYIRHKTGSLFSPLAYHILNNFIAVLILYYFPDMRYFSPTSMEHLPLWLILPSVALLAASLFFMGRKKMDSQTGS